MANRWLRWQTDGAISQLVLRYQIQRFEVLQEIQLAFWFLTVYSFYDYLFLQSKAQNCEAINLN